MSLRSKSRTTKKGPATSKGRPTKGKAASKRKAASPKGSTKKSKSRPASKPKPATKKAAKGKSKSKGTADKAKALKAKAKAKEREAAEKAKAKEREKAAAEKAKAKERELKEREKAAAEKAAAEKAKAKERELKEREKAAAEKAKVKERELKEREKLQAKAQKEREVEAARLKKEKEAARIAKEKARIAENERKKQEREDERLRLVAERDAARELARKLKDDEKAQRDAEREAYRRAKDAERERIRAEREAARRLLEGKVARASKRAQRDAARGAGSRVYRADAIPNQAGTTRRVLDTPSGQLKLVGVRAMEASDIQTAPEPSNRAAPPPPPAAPPSMPIEERYARILGRLATTELEFRREYRESFDMSWVYHDSALEGVVYTYQELRTAIDPTATVIPDGMQPVYEEIRRHRQAIEYVRELAERKRVPINVDTIKKIYVILHPEEGDLKSVKYRKDIPQHRLYFHEYAAPDKIAYRVRQVIDWLNGPEPKKLKSPIRIASRVHFDLLRVFPFPNDSGKVSRLLMNALLMRAGYPPAIIHSTERQRYYEALKGQLPIILQMASDSINNALLSIEKRFDEYESARPSAAPGSTEEVDVLPLPPVRPAHELDDLIDLDDTADTDDDDGGGSDDDGDSASAD